MSRGGGSCRCHSGRVWCGRGSDARPASLAGHNVRAGRDGVRQPASSVRNAPDGPKGQPQTAADWRQFDSAGISHGSANRRCRNRQSDLAAPGLGAPGLGAPGLAAPGFARRCTGQAGGREVSRAQASRLRGACRRWPASDARAQGRTGISPRPRAFRHRSAWAALPDPAPVRRTGIGRTRELRRAGETGRTAPLEGPATRGRELAAESGSPASGSAAAAGSAAPRSAPGRPTGQARPPGRRRPAPRRRCRPGSPVTRPSPATRPNPPRTNASAPGTGQQVTSEAGKYGPVHGRSSHLQRHDGPCWRICTPPGSAAAPAAKPSAAGHRRNPGPGSQSGGGGSAGMPRSVSGSSPCVSGRQASSRRPRLSPGRRSASQLCVPG